MLTWKRVSFWAENVTSYFHYGEEKKILGIRESGTVSKKDKQQECLRNFHLTRRGTFNKNLNAFNFFD